MVSHATSQETQRQTYSLNVFLSDVTTQETQRQTYQLDVFASPMISHATSEKTQTDSLSGCVFRCHDEPCNLSGNTDRLTLWMCFQVP